MRELPVYNGAQPQAARQQVVQEVSVPKVDLHGDVVNHAIEQAQAIGQKLVDLYDFTESQKTELARRGNKLDMELELQQKMALQYDDPDGFYLPNGRINQEAVQAFIAKWQERNAQVQGDFIDSRRLTEDEYRRQTDDVTLAKGVMIALSKQELENRQQVFRENMALAEAQGDFGSMRRSLNEGRRDGLLSGRAHKAELAKLNKKEYAHHQDQLMQQVQRAALSGGDAFAELYDDPAFRKRLSPENQLKLDTMASRMAPDVPEQRFREVQEADGSVRLEAEPREAPRGLPRGMVAVWERYNGNFDTIEAKTAARGEYLKYLRAVVQHANDPAELEHAKLMGKEFGQSESLASAAVKNLQAEIAGTAKFNAKDAMKVFSGKGMFFRPQNQQKLDDFRSQYAALQGVTRTKKQETEYKRLGEAVKKWEGYDAKEYNAASAAILQRFDQWQLAHPDATYRQQARAFYQFVHDHSSEDAAELDVKALTNEASGIYERSRLANMEQRYEAGEAMKTEIAMAEDMRQQRAEQLDEAARQRADEYAAREITEETLDRSIGVSNGWEGNADAAILYVPKGHKLAGKYVRIATPRDVVSGAKVVEHDGCTAPVLSQGLRRNLGLMQNPYGTLTFDGLNGTLSKGSVMEGRVTAKALGGLAPLYNVYLDAAARNGLDPKLLMAISMHETGRGTSATFRNKKNAMGVSDANGPRTFKRVEDSIYFMAEQLKKNYIDKGLTTVEQIGAKYAPVGAENDPRSLNQHWVGGVSKYMKELNN